MKNNLPIQEKVRANQEDNFEIPNAEISSTINGFALWEPMVVILFMVLLAVISYYASGYILGRI